MGNLTLNGATSGQITLAPPSVAGTNTISLPAQTATVLTDSSAAMNIGSGQIYKDASGNVGIGTTSPSSYGGKLTVLSGSTALSGYFESTDTSTYSATSFNAGSRIAIRGSNSTTNAYQSIRFSNSAAGNFEGFFGGVLNSSGYCDFVWQSYNGSYAERMRIDSSGNLLVGTTSAGVSNSLSTTIETSGANNSRISVNHSSTAGSSNGSYYMQFGYGGNLIGSISQNSTTTVAYNTSSDYRLKENVQPMTTGLAKISALKPVTYDWISDKSEGEGFIAHELQAVIPNAVTGEKDAVDEDGNIKPQGVDYSKIVVHLVAAMQEQQSIIEDLKARLAVLEAK